MPTDSKKETHTHKGRRKPRAPFGRARSGRARNAPSPSPLRYAGLGLARYALVQVGRETRPPNKRGLPRPRNPRAPPSAAPTLASVLRRATAPKVRCIIALCSGGGRARPLGCAPLYPPSFIVAFPSVGVARARARPSLFGQAFPRCRAFYYSCCGGSRPRARWARGSAAHHLWAACVLSSFVRLRPALRLAAAPRPRCALVGRALPMVARPSPRAHLYYALQTSRLSARAPRYARGNACDKWHAELLSRYSGPLCRNTTLRHPAPDPRGCRFDTNFPLTSNPLLWGLCPLHPQCVNRWYRLLRFWRILRVSTPSSALNFHKLC